MTWVIIPISYIYTQRNPLKNQNLSRKKKLFITSLETYYLVGENMKKIFKKKFRKKKDRIVLKAAFKLCLKQPNKNLCENACTL